MPTGYGHNTCGINVQNLRSLATASPSTPANITLLPGGLRTDSSWKREVDEFRIHAEYRGQLSTRVRTDNMELQATAEQQVETCVGKVEAALQSKLAKTQALTQSLEQALTAVNHELAGLSRSQHRLNNMAAHLKQKAGVNKSRQQVRCDRPAREQTCDEVTRALAKQQDILGSFVDRVQHGLMLVTVDMDKLNNCRQQLTKDLKDKAAALQVDELVLGVKQDPSSTATTTTTLKSGATVSCSAAAGASKASSSGKYSHSWEQQTVALVQEAQHLAAGAGRLRKALKQLLQEAQGSTHAIAEQLDNSMATKLQATALLREDLNVQLHKVQDEFGRATQQRDSLRKSLQDKMVPLKQLEARYSIRAARPQGETVDDEVHYALAQEAAQLSGFCAQLAQRVDAADTQVAHLDDLSAALLSNIADKEAAMTLEEKIALLDGRMYPAVPPTPSVLSVCSSVASGYSRLGHSASQAGSRSGTPSARPWTSAPGQRGGSPSRTGSSPVRGTGSRAGSPHSIARSGYSAGSSAIARIAALEQELAHAKVQTELLQKTIEGLKTADSNA